MPQAGDPLGPTKHRKLTFAHYGGKRGARADLHGNLDDLRAATARNQVAKQQQEQIHPPINMGFRHAPGQPVRFPGNLGGGGHFPGEFQPAGGNGGFGFHPGPGFPGEFQPAQSNFVQKINQLDQGLVQDLNRRDQLQDYGQNFVANHQPSNNPLVRIAQGLRPGQGPVSHGPMPVQGQGVNPGGLFQPAQGNLPFLHLGGGVFLNPVAGTIHGFGPNGTVTTTPGATPNPAAGHMLPPTLGR